jgi:hypothetical protein
MSKHELLAVVEDGWRELDAAIAGLDAADLPGQARTPPSTRRIFAPGAEAGVRS